MVSTWLPKHLHYIKNFSAEKLCMDIVRYTAVIIIYVLSSLFVFMSCDTLNVGERYVT